MRVLQISVVDEDLPSKLNVFDLITFPRPYSLHILPLVRPDVPAIEAEKPRNVRPMNQ